MQLAKLDMQELTFYYKKNANYHILDRYLQHCFYTIIISWILASQRPTANATKQKAIRDEKGRKASERADPPGPPN